MLWYLILMLVEMLLDIEFYRLVFHLRFTGSVLRWSLFAVLCLSITIAGYKLVGGRIYQGIVLLDCLMLPLMYKGSHRLRAFAYSPLVFLGLVLSGNLLLAIASLYIPMSSEYTDLVLKTEVTFDTAQLIIMSIALFLFLRFSRGQDDEVHLSLPQYVLLLTGSVACLLVCSFLQYTYLDDYITNTNGVLFGNFIFAIVSILFYTICMWEYYADHRADSLREQNRQYSVFIDSQAEQISSIIRTNNEVRRFRHDYDAHMRMLTGYLQDNNVSGALGYISDITSAYLPTHSPVLTGVPSLDHLVDSYMEQAREYNIVCEFTGFISDSTGINMTDICIIMSNVMQNAIEACQAVTADRFIRVTMTRRGNMLFIHCENSTAGPVDIERTSKSDSAGHGIGIGNVRRILEHNHGTFSHSSSDGSFSVEIVYNCT